MSRLEDSGPLLTSLLALVTLACGGSGSVEPPPVATHVAVHEGNNQSAPPGTTLATAPSVKVTDANGNPVSGVAVTFAVASGGGSITGANQTSNGQGIATLGSWTLGATAGTNTLTATAVGLTGSPITFTAIGEGSTGGPSILMAIYSGFSHTCGLTARGAAFCWGWNESGQLGNGTSVNSTTPVAVSGGLNFSVLALGVYHTCGLTASGAAYCWGGNEFGQLGTGSNTPSLTPVPVSGDLSFRTLSAGEHNCGLTNTGAAFCWGRNEDGQLGNGSFDNSRIPAAVSGDLTFSALATGIYHTCGLIAGGAAYCWGWNERGQLGNGQLGIGAHSSTPVVVAGGYSFSALAAGFGWHSCALAHSGAAYCWGDNGQGELGNGSRDYGVAAPVAVSGGLSFSTIVTGAFHTCGLTTIETDYCWGDDHWGELGDSSGTCETCESSTPVEIYGAFRFRRLSGGGGHTCGIARDGPAYCWGLNEYGQLGNGTTINQSAPAAVVWPEDMVVAGTQLRLGAAALHKRGETQH